MTAHQAIEKAHQRYAAAQKNLFLAVSCALPLHTRVTVRIGRASVTGRITGYSTWEPHVVWMTNERTGKQRKFAIGPYGNEWESAE